MTQQEILEVILENPGITQKDLCQITGLSKTSVVEQTRKLAQKKEILRVLVREKQQYMLYAKDKK